MATPTGAERNHFLLLAAAALLLLIALAGLLSTRAPAGGGGPVTDVRGSLAAVVQTADAVARQGVPASRLGELAAQVDAAQEQLNAQAATLPAEAQASVTAFATAWAAMKPPLESIQQQAPNHSRALTNLKVITDAIAPAFAVYEEALEKVSRGASNNDVAGVSRQLVRLHRLQTLSQQLRGNASAETAAALAAEATAFSQTHRALTAAGTLERAVAKTVSDSFATVETAIAAVQQDLAAAGAVQAAAAALPALEQQAVAAFEPLLAQTGSATPGPGSRLTLVFAALGLLGLLLTAGYAWLSYRSARQRALAVKVQEETQQQAILSLLDEITNLANGDLTGELTVTADFTGNIADSLNYTVQTLRGLVGTINDTSVEIAAAASSTTGRVQQMSTAAEGQAREIVRATQAISFASRSLEDVAGRAEKLAEQAKGSVETAHSGAATVGRTIAGMSTLREQIQDTAKRIKRLGESSQEIGNIIEFINDIAEQTNTLALNASIQAAMAGESGRGFAVVADQVRQLAERAGSATRQIENLIKTIQADTQEAITSMERSTANVVGGAKSAEEAGLSLTRIEASSQELAKVIQDIAGASRAQSAETTKLAAVMQGIREVSMQTSATAHQTAESVNELNTLSAKLRESVSGFKLPMDVSQI